MIEKILKTLKKNKTLVVLLLCLLLGVLLILSDAQKGDSNTKKDELYTLNTYKQELENNLESVIQNISGITNVNVLITLESGSEYVYASDDSEVSEKHVVVNNGLVVVKEKLPTIKGVAVVCSGGNDAKLKIKITELICSVLNISSARVYVTE